MRFRSSIPFILSLASGSVFAQVPDAVVTDTVSATPQAEVCLVLPLSGLHADLGERVAGAVARVLRDTNADPEAPRFDTAGTVEGAASAMERAAAAGCRVVVGGLGDREAIAVADAAERLGVPTICLGQEPDALTRGHVLWARTPRDDPIRALAGHLIAVRGEARASLLYPDNPYGHKAARAFSSGFQALGGRIRVEMAFDGSRADIKDVASRFATVWNASGEGLDCEAEVIFVVSGYVEARRLVPFLKYDEVIGRTGGGGCPPVTVAGTSTWNRPVQIARGGDELQGALFADVAFRGPEEGEVGTRLLEVEARDAALLALKALAVSGGSGIEGILSSFRSGLEVKGASGELRVERGRVQGRRIGVYEIDRGEIVSEGGL